MTNNHLATIHDGNTTYVVWKDQDRFVHFESKWTGDDGTVRGSEIVFSADAAADLAKALSASAPRKRYRML